MTFAERLPSRVVKRKRRVCSLGETQPLGLTRLTPRLPSAILLRWSERSRLRSSRRGTSPQLATGGVLWCNPKTARPAATNSGPRKGFRKCIRHRTTDTPQLYLHVRRKASGNRLSLSRSGKCSSPGGFSTRACSCRMVCLPAAWFPTVPSFFGHGWRAMPGPGASASRCCPPWQATLASRSGRSNATWPNWFRVASSALARGMPGVPLKVATPV